MSSASVNLIKSRKGKQKKMKDKKSKGDKKSPRSGIKCDHCGKPAHDKANCWELNPNKCPKWWTGAANAMDKTLSKSDDKSSGKDAQDSLESCMLSVHAITTDGDAQPSDEAAGKTAEAMRVEKDDDIGIIKADIGSLYHLQPTDWIIDSGSTEHLICSPNRFVPGTVRKYKREIRTATREITSSTVMGSVLVKMAHPASGVREVVLTDVLYVPEVKV
jgi:hypothetical protein